MDIVVTTDSTTFSFNIDEGEVIFTGVGDHHNSQFSKYARTRELFTEHNIATFASYKLTFYPRREFFHEYETNIPIYTLS